MLLNHSLGRNWSLFLSAYIESLIENVLNIKTDIDTHDEAVKVRFTR